METHPLTSKDTLNQLASSAQRLTTSFNGGNMVWHSWTSEHESNSTIILLHGGFGSWTHWARVIPKLKKHSTVIAADLPGLGDSDDVPLPHSAKQLAGIVKHGIEQLLPADEPFHLVGFSFGGMLGSLVAASFDTQCLTFTAVGASGFGDLHYIVDGIAMPTSEMTTLQARDIHTNNLRLLMFAPLSKIDALSLYIHQTNVSRGRIKSRRMSTTDALVKALPHIKARIGGIWGELDSTGGGLKAINERANIFRQHQPEAPFDIIDGAGHWVMYEQPLVFTKILLQQLGLLGK
jgi:2-hydroxy-6-oxonona-2,4-dienedioate hydrolase